MTPTAGTQDMTNVKDKMTKSATDGSIPPQKYIDRSIELAFAHSMCVSQIVFSQSPSQALNIAARGAGSARR